MNDRELDQGVRQWERLCHKIVRRWTSIPRGLTYEDLLQEARLGLFGGLKTYDPAKGVPLVNYLATCAQHEVWKALKSANAGKHRPLNEATTNVVYGEGEEVSIFDLLEDEPEDRPDYVVEQASEADGLSRALAAAVERAGLSRQQVQVLNAVLDGGSWEQIGAELGISPSTASTVMGHVKEKLALVFDAEAEVV